MAAGPITMESPDAGGRQRLMRDAVVNNLSAPLLALIGLLLVPFMLRELGQDAYGLWIIATSLLGILSSIDLGLGWSVTRVVAAERMGAGKRNADFFGSAATVYVLMGLAGFLVMGAAGLLFRERLDLPPVDRETVIAVFALAGAAACAEKINAYGYAVLSGLRRFGLINLIASVGAAAWAVGAVAVLMSGGSVVAVVACHLAVSVIKTAWTMGLIARVHRGYRIRPGFFAWNALRPHVAFTLKSLLTGMLNGLVWNSGPVLTGLVGGPASAVPFYIGQKIPLAVSVLGWRAAEVLFPAVSESRHDPGKSGEVLRVGSRWLLVLFLPPLVLLFLAAPHILRAWLVSVPPDSVEILRLMVLVILADLFLMAPTQVLWGSAVMRPLLVVNVAQGTSVVALTLILLHLIGVTGAAWGMLIPITACSIALFTIAARHCRVSPWDLVNGMRRGLALPVLLCLASEAAVLHFSNGSRFWVSIAVAAGGAAYLLALFGFSGTFEEKQFARTALSRMRWLCSSSYRGVRGMVARSGGAHGR